MSSSTHTNDATYSGAGSTARSVDKSSGFRRWSRNLSAQRHRELDRLNQIERRRQFLELKLQNDLFNQMSVTANGPSNIVGPLNGVKTLKQGDNLAKDVLARPDSRQQLVEKAALTEHTGQPSQTNENALINRSSTLTSHLPKSRLTSLSSPEDKQLDETATNKGKANKPLDAHHKFEFYDTGAEVGLDKIQALEASGSTSSKTRADDKVGSGSSSKMPISTEQLIKFVSARVPENKRVLCLIVRDKISRLNKANSYFYPTYYLFIQAIVNIDQASETYNQASSDDLAANIVNNSADNSFSASSSLSADMLFIGTQENGASTPNGKLFGNSYSDNEVCTDTETELSNSNFTKKFPKQQSKVKLQGAAKESESALQGRDSPFVFPNTSAAGDESSPGSWMVPNDSVLAKDKSIVVGLTVDNTTKVAVNNQASAGRRIEIKSLEMSVDESYENGDDDDESDIDDSKSKPKAHSKRMDEVVASGRSIHNDEEVRYDDEEESLFDNEVNPYTGINGVLLAGRRRKKVKTYLIGPNEYGYTRKDSICKLKSNVLGTQFNAIRLNQAENNDRCTIASVSYETNVLGFKGPRKMRVFLAKDPNKEAKNLSEMFKKNPNAVVQLKNMTPFWNVESQSYVLNFHGRVTQASVKNFQLIQCEDNPSEIHKHQCSSKQQLAQSAEPLPQSFNQTQPKNKKSPPTDQPPTETDERLPDETLPNIKVFGSSANNGPTCGGIDVYEGSLVDKNSLIAANKGLTYNSSIIMQFGRISNHEFTCDVTYPLSILQAFAIALSSFDSKLACE